MFVLVCTLISFSHALWVLLGYNEAQLMGNFTVEPPVHPDYFANFSGSLKYSFLALTSDYKAFIAIDGQNPWADFYR